MKVLFRDCVVCVEAPIPQECKPVSSQRHGVEHKGKDVICDKVMAV